MYLSYLCKLIFMCHQRRSHLFCLLPKHDFMVEKEVLAVVKMLLLTVSFTL